MPDPFHGRIAGDCLYDPVSNTWVRVLADARVRIGASAYGLHLAGEIIMFTGKPGGAEVLRGKGLGTVETGKTILAVHAPVSLAELETNEAAEVDPARINLSPYGEGWLACGRPLDWDRESGLLVSPETYRQMILTADPEAVIEE